MSEIWKRCLRRHNRDKKGMREIMGSLRKAEASHESKFNYVI